MTRHATDAEIAELRAGLEGVTPGPFTTSISLSPMGGTERAIFCESAGVIAQIDGVGRDALAAHIARCSPDFISALLARLDAQETALREAITAWAITDDNGKVVPSLIFGDEEQAQAAVFALSDTYDESRIVPVVVARARLAKQEPGQ